MTERVDVHVTARPTGPLRGRVAHVSGWEQAGTPPQLHRGLLGLPAGELAHRDEHARCRAETGLAPQELRRVARFDRARRAPAAGSPPATVAADHGYADQAHLTREVTRFAGLPPRRWLAAERRSVRDTDRRTTPASPA